MPSNKPRLYLVLFGTPSDDGSDIMNHHWGFITGPKFEASHPTLKTKGICYHIMDHPLKGWTYEECTLSDIRSMPRMLVRTLIGKVEDMILLIEILRTTPIPTSGSMPNEMWMSRAVSRLARSRPHLAVRGRDLRWEVVGKGTWEYAIEKSADCRFPEDGHDGQPRPVWDFLENREVVR